MLESIALSLNEIKNQLGYLEEIAQQLEGIGADTETIIKSQYMSEWGQTIKNP